MTRRLAGTVALVTGASSGIGEATAVALAAEGATVAIAARRRDRLEQVVERIGNDADVLVIETDITDEASSRAMVQSTVTEFGRLDTLVNNAGVMLLGPIVDAPVEEWRRMVELNVLGLLYATHAALPSRATRPATELTLTTSATRRGSRSAASSRWGRAAWVV
jgi:NADP-dependent 3-hydroxy acid dehydrogenase YdfG